MASAMGTPGVVDMADLFAKISAVTPVTAPSTYNGQCGRVDMARPIDYTGDYGKIVVHKIMMSTPLHNIGLEDEDKDAKPVATAKVTFEGEDETKDDDPDDNAPQGGNGPREVAMFDFRETAAYILHLVQGKPTVDTAVSQAHLQEFWPYFSECLARYRMYQLFSAGRCEVNFRSNDVVPAIGNTHVAIHGFVDRMYTHIASENGYTMELAAAEVAQNVLHSFVANAIHRHQTEGHSWYTDANDRRGTPTNRAIAVAGASKDTFQKYMRRRGHDGNHHLTDSSIHSIAYGLTRDHGPVIVNTAIVYQGVLVAGKTLAEVLPVGEAASDRYPPGELGLAAMIIGTQLIISMVNDITKIVKVTGHIPVIAKLDHISARYRSVAKTMRKNIENLMAPTLSMAYGYCAEAGLHEEDYNMAIKKHAERNLSSLNGGRSLAKAVKAATPHSEAIASAITTMIANLGGSLDAIGALPTGAAGDVIDASPPLDYKSIKAEVGVPAADRLMAALAKGGGGTTFYDAST